MHSGGRTTGSFSAAKSKSEGRILPSRSVSDEQGKRSYEEKTIEDRDSEEYHAKDKPKEGESRAWEPIDRVGPAMGTSEFSKLMEGVVLVLSGFVNPERSTLRTQALEMGAEYKPDWTSDCTLLVCAFPNTPKFRQVEANSGTIVSKEWISECYKEKKLVEIEPYLMHAGKPWRKLENYCRGHQDQEISEPKNRQSKLQKENIKGIGRAAPELSLAKVTAASDTLSGDLSPSKVEKWAIEDLHKTIQWLESQEEKPDPSELKNIASEGILTCLQDSISALKENQDIRHATEQWKFVPRVVEELAKLDESRTGSHSISREELSRKAIACERIYQRVFDNLDTRPGKGKKMKTDKRSEGSKENREVASHGEGSDSDDTIEMTEEEIEIACREFASKQ